jgi:hypothetical protein
VTTVEDLDAAPPVTFAESVAAAPAPLPGAGAGRNRGRSGPGQGAEPAPDRPRRRRPRWWWIGLGAVLVAAAAAGGWTWTSNSAPAPASSGPGPVATAVVERGTITATQQWDGTLAAGTPFTVTAGAGGVITRLAEPGAAVERGDVLYRRNEQPVVLLLGPVPMYRDLAPGDTGADAEQLAANLESLGYRGFTDQAVRNWQADLGVPRTGRVSMADVVFLPEGGRVDSLHAGVGMRIAPGAPVLTITGTDQVVNVQAELADRDRLRADTEVTVVLPDGAEAAGTVATIAAADVPAGAGEGAAGGGTEPESLLEVEIALAEPAPEELIGTTVEVVVATDRRESVLLVPVTALLALAEGGYGLEVVDEDGTSSIVTVTTGLFAAGKVEVGGPDIAAGTVVGMAGR